MKMKKTLLLTSAAVLALGLGIPSKAQAFDTVNWEWNKTLTGTENVDVDIDIISPDATGIVELEKIQMNIGNVTATSNVNGIENNPPGVGEDGTVLIDETVSINLLYENPNGGTVPNVGSSVVYAAPDNEIDVEVIDGQLTESPQTNAHNDLIDLRLTGEIEATAIEGINDAVDLPVVASAATAVANNQSITSSVGVNLHDAQINFGGFGEGTGFNNLPVPPEEAFAGAFDATGNTHTNLLLTAGLSGALGIITPGEVTATSTVADITNASIDSTATAVGNNLSVDLAAFTPDDAFVLADLTQFNYADVNATSDVTGISVDNYANLGVLEGPLVNSVATAVGNNASITVSSPAAAAVTLP